ncbi:MAG: tryptophan-rich sensory protein [Ruminococcus sp.]|nr:tryptophan-rich sensory protein [Ruminococcus sp.]
MPGMGNYQKAAKPPLTPPEWLFPVAWTILFLLMGISSYIIYTNKYTDSETRKQALWIYGIQLAVNFVWPILFFSLSAYLFSFVWIILLLVLVVLMTRKFYEISPLAGLLQIPYVLWTAFATYLTFGVFILNM